MELIPSGPPKQVAKIADDLSKAFCQMTQLGALAGSKAGAESRGQTTPDHVSSVYVASVGVIGGLHVLASLLGHHGDQFREQVEPNDVPKLINPVSTLLAAILVQTMAPAATDEGEGPNGDGRVIGMNIEFSPEIMLDAIQQVERITGRPVDGFIRPSMLKSVRKLADNSDEPMNKFLAQRRATPGNLH